MFDRSDEGGATELAPPEAESLGARMAALPDLPVPVLKEVWLAAWGTPPPKGARRRFLMLGIAWRWQARIQGGYSRVLERRLAALETTFRQNHRLGPVAVKAVPRPMPGTRLLRVWHGEHHEVHVTEAGYIWRGETHASLSAIARAITGARRNGPAFFGLRDGGRGS